MKIHQLPDGAHFEYAGEEYVKTGPMFATGPGGQRRMIPKYAVLKPLGPAAGTAEKPRGDTLQRAKVLAALEAFHAECRSRVAPEHRAAVDAARERFLMAID